MISKTYLNMIFAIISIFVFFGPKNSVLLCDKGVCVYYKGVCVYCLCYIYLKRFHQVMKVFGSFEEVTEYKVYSP